MEVVHPLRDIAGGDAFREQVGHKVENGDDVRFGEGRGQFAREQRLPIRSVEGEPALGEHFQRVRKLRLGVDLLRRVVQHGLHRPHALGRIERALFRNRRVQHVCAHAVEQVVHAEFEHGEFAVGQFAFVDHDVAEELPVHRKFRRKVGIAEILHAEISVALHLLHAHRRGGACGLCHDHVRRLHADGAVRRMRSGEADGHVQVDALLFLRADGLIRDGIIPAGLPEVAVRLIPVGDAAARIVLDQEVGDAVRVEPIEPLPDRMRRGRLLNGAGDRRRNDVALAHHIVADHAPALAQVDLHGEVAVLGKFVLGKPVGAHLLADGKRHALVIGIEVQQPEHVVPVVVLYVLAAEVVAVRILVAHADEVRMVGIRLVVGHLAQRQLVARIGVRLQNAGARLVPLGVVVFGLGDGHHVVGVGAERKAEAVRLHAAVRRARRAERAVLDEGQQPAVRVALDDEGACRLHFAVVGQDAVHRLAVLAVRLAPDDVRHARLRHEVALIGAVDEHLRAELFAALGDDLPDTRAVHDDARIEVDPLVEDDGHAVVCEHLAEDLFRHVRLEHPLHAQPVVLARVNIHAERLKVLFARLRSPRRIVEIVLVHAVVELVRKPADDLLVRHVGRAEPGARKPADEVGLGDEQHAHALLLCRDGGGDARARRTVDDDVVVTPLRHDGQLCRVCLL